MKFAILTVLAEGGKGYEPIPRLFLHEGGHSGCVSQSGNRGRSKFLGYSFIKVGIPAVLAGRGTRGRNPFQKKRVMSVYLFQYSGWLNYIPLKSTKLFLKGAHKSRA